MPQKISIIENLAQEKKLLEIRRDNILDDVDKERMELSDEYPNPVLEDMLTELQTLVDNIFQLENTIRLLKETTKKSNKKIGNEINVGDCVMLKNRQAQRQYFITGDSHYVNPGIGIISSSSPIAQQLLSRKFGESLALSFNGAKTEYQLLPF